VPDSSEYRQVETYRVSASSQAQPDEWRFASAGPSFLKLLFGEACRQRRVLASGVNWQRVLFIAVDGEVAGYLQFFLRGEGPHRPCFDDVRGEFGWSALWRYPLYCGLMQRFRRPEAYTYRLIIKEAYRGQGLGQQLMRDWMAILQDEQVEQAELDVWGANQAAIRFYSRLGFSAVKTRRLKVLGRWLPDGAFVRMARPVVEPDAVAFWQER
jgi:ribosomal protein S18 acetylase RimI-like enzyme